MKCIFLYNPKSGKGALSTKLDYIKQQLQTKFDEVTIYETLSAEDTVEQAKKACYLYDAILFSGGDGTFNDVACGVATQSVRPVLGYIPSGTVNDIARNLKIPRNFKKAIQVILDGETVFHDVGKINDRFFIYVAALGTFSGVSYRTTHDAKKLLGRLAYAFDGLKEISNPTLSKIHLKTEADDVEIDTPLVLILNSVSVGGVPFNKNGHLNDGRFDILIVKKGAYSGLLNIIKLFILGILRLRRSHVTYHFKSSNFTIDVLNEPTWCIDGEAGNKGTVKIENLHNYLEIYIPKKANKKTKSKLFK
ncbi:MAG: diacylglycerol kinase family protein [Bacilli bacterium]